MQTKEKEPLLAYVARTTQNDEYELRKHSFNRIIDNVVLAQRPDGQTSDGALLTIS